MKLGRKLLLVALIGVIGFILYNVSSNSQDKDIAQNNETAEKSYGSIAQILKDIFYSKKDQENADLNELSATDEEIEIIEDLNLADETIRTRNLKTKKALETYFIESSDIGFIASSLSINNAFTYLKSGDHSRLETIIKSFQNNYEEFKKIKPPPEAAEIHNKSLDLVKRFIALLESINSNPEKAGELWESKEKKSIIEEGKKVTQDIAKIIITYQLELPDNVFPSYFK